MKKQIQTIKTLIQSTVVLVAMSVVSSAKAQTVASGDINNDGLTDVAAITSATTITVSLGRPDGSYAVSATLPAPKNRTFVYVYINDYDGDGIMDVRAIGPASGGWTYIYTWLGNGDGTFGSRMTDKWAWKGHIGSF